MRIDFDAIKYRFRPPEYVLLPDCNLDISDHSIKYMEVKEVGPNTIIPDVYDRKEIEKGIIIDGAIQDLDKLKKELDFFRKKYRKYEFVNIALPEELAYVFDMEISKSETKDNIYDFIEYKLNEFIPIDPQKVLFDFDLIKETERSKYVGVTVYPVDIVNDYIQAVECAGFKVKSAESEIVSMARSVVDKENKDSVIAIFDFGNSKITMAVMIGSVPLFSTTININTKAIFEKLHSVPSRQDSILDNMDDWKFKQGLIATDPEFVKRETSEFLLEIEKYTDYWVKHKESIYGSIKVAYLCGGNASLRGLDALMSKTLGFEVRQGNVWENMFNLEEYVPSIDRKHSFSLATLSGLSIK